MEASYSNLSASHLFLILALILFLRRSPHKRSNNFLGVLSLLLAFYDEVIRFHSHCVHTKNLSHLSSYLPLDALLLMLMSPCLYFYVLLVLNRPLKLTFWGILARLIPLVPCVVFNVLFYCRPVDERVDWLIRDFYSGSPEMTIINTLLYLQILFYLIAGYHAVLSEAPDRIWKIGFGTDTFWIRMFLLLNIVFVLLSLPVCFAINNEQTSIRIGEGALNLDFVFLFVMAILRLGTVSAEKKKEKKNPDPIQTEQALSYWKTLTEYMETRKPYLDEDCSLPGLAESINMPERQLSILLNVHGGTSFAVYINDYRVKESIVHLQDRSKYRKYIDEIALDCGFGSRSSFYRAFRKVYGMTPTDYRKQYDTMLQIRLDESPEEDSTPKSNAKS